MILPPLFKLVLDIRGAARSNLCMIVIINASRKRRNCPYGTVCGRVKRMLNKPSIPKFIISAAAGFLIGAALVVFPGPGFGHLNWAAGDGQALKASRIFNRNIAVNFHLNEQERRLGADLYNRAIWLCILQNEIECLPFLMLTSSLGPVMLLICWRKPEPKMEQTA